MTTEPTKAELAEIVGALASGARIRLDRDCQPELIMPSPKLDGITWDRLCHHGWLDTMPNGGTFKLSDAGLLAYLRSTDEMGDGKLIDPTEYQQ